MVAYHDAEWGVPVRGDTELFERLALESFQAGLSWSTILRKREAFRTAFRGFDPAVVAAFGPADRARLLADAGIVRNRPKIDATIGNAAGCSRSSRRTARSPRTSTNACPARRPPCHPRPVAGHDPGHDAGLGRAVGGSPPAWLRVRRFDDRLRVHAERRPRRRSPARLLPLPRNGR